MSTRRRFCGQSLTSAAALALGGSATGCKRRKDSLLPDTPDIGKKSTPETFAVLVPIAAGQTAALQEQLEDHVFEVASPGVHYARMTIIDDRLHLSMVYDNDIEAALQLMERNATRLDPILALTENFPSQGVAYRPDFSAWLQAYTLPNLLLYSAFDRGSEPAIRESVRLRDNFMALAETVTREPTRAEPAWTEFLEENRARIHNHSDNAEDQLTPFQLRDPNLQNPFTMVFTVIEEKVPKLVDTLKVGEWAIERLDIHPLKEIPTVHYARFSRYSQRQMLFDSVYDGEWEQYVDDFATRIPGKLDKVWGDAVGYPPGKAKDAPELKKFLEARRIERDYFYMAYTEMTVKEIQKSLALGKALVKFSQRASSVTSRLDDELARFIRENQALMA